MSYIAIDEFKIAHYGILGMRWGVRRFQNEDGSLTPEGKRRYSKRDPSRMTDEELRTIITRNKLENDYQRARKDALELRRQIRDLEHPATAKAKSITEKVIIGSGTVAASAFVTKYMGAGLDELSKRLSEQFAR